MNSPLLSRLCSLVLFTRWWVVSGGLLLFGLFLVQSGCERPVVFVEDAELGFSSDSVKFDTLFTTVKSPTERLFIYNKSNNDLRIKSIKIAGGENSPFRLTYNGIKKQTHTGQPLASGDSVYAFFDFQAATQSGDQDFIDYLEIELGSRTIRVVLFARVLDAYLYNTDSDVCNKTLPVDKPCVIDGLLYIEKGCTLTIPAGARLYYSSRRIPFFDRQTGQLITYDFISRIYCEGTLLVEGLPSNPVLMTSLRLAKDYQESPGQWLGVQLAPESRGSVIENALIKNGSIGIIVDSSALDANSPKLRLQNVEIRNMTNFCILARGFVPNPGVAQYAIDASNVLAYDAGVSVVGLYGGGFNRFVNCTFVRNTTAGIPQDQPCIAVKNFQTFEQGGVRQNVGYAMSTEFQNCILWGNREDEFGAERLLGIPYDLILNHNLARTRRDLFNNNGNIINQDPQFVDAAKRNYKLKNTSPAIDAGLDNDQVPNQDFGGLARPNGLKPEIGAFEYYPE